MEIYITIYRRIFSTDSICVIYLIVYLIITKNIIMFLPDISTPAI